MKKNALSILSIALNVLFLVLVLRLSGQVKDLRYEMKQDLQSIEENVDGALSNALYEMQQTLESSAQLYLSYGLEPAGVDAATESILADAALQLKRWSDDAAVTLFLTQNGEKQELPMTHEGGGRFTVPVRFGTQAGEIRLAFSVTEKGVTTVEELGGWQDIFMLLPLQTDGWGYSGPTLVGNVLTLGGQNVTLRDAHGEPARAEDTEFRVYRNGVLEKTVPARYAPDQGYGDTETVKLTGVSEDDSVEVTFACRDSYGLHYEFPLYHWGAEDSAFSVSNQRPTLTWK